MKHFSITLLCLLIHSYPIVAAHFAPMDEFHEAHPPKSASNSHDEFPLLIEPTTGGDLVYIPYDKASLKENIQKIRVNEEYLVKCPPEAIYFLAQTVFVLHPTTIAKIAELQQPFLIRLVQAAGQAWDAAINSKLADDSTDLENIYRMLTAETALVTWSKLTVKAINFFRTGAAESSDGYSDFPINQVLAKAKLISLLPSFDDKKILEEINKDAYRHREKLSALSRDQLYALFEISALSWLAKKEYFDPTTFESLLENVQEDLSAYLGADIEEYVKTLVGEVREGDPKMLPYEIFLNYIATPSST